MSKSISANLKSHFGQEVTTIATCWKLTRRDATVFGFTKHDADVAVGGVTYLAATGFLPSANSQNAALAVDNMEAVTFLDSETITEADVQAGLFDYAGLDVFQVNYADVTMGVVYLAKNWTLGEAQIHDHTVTCEVRGLAARLAQNTVEVTSPDCRATLGDSRCGVDVAGSYTVTGTVTSVDDRYVFYDTGRTEPVGTFNYGVVTWTSGDNSGFEMEVRNYFLSNHSFTLFQPMPYDIAIGDTYSVTYGCNRTAAVCKATFSNFVNFRGEPFIPGPDVMLDGPW